MVKEPANKSLELMLTEPPFGAPRFPRIISARPTAGMALGVSMTSRFAGPQHRLRPLYYDKQRPHCPVSVIVVIVGRGTHVPGPAQMAGVVCCNPTNHADRAVADWIRSGYPPE